MKYSRDDAIDRAVRERVANGWTATHSGRHVKLRSPTGLCMSIPGTPGDVRSRMNCLAQIRRISRADTERDSGDKITTSSRS